MLRRVEVDITRLDQGQLSSVGEVIGHSGVRRRENGHRVCTKKLTLLIRKKENTSTKGTFRKIKEYGLNLT
jgi:hypothetical protein